MGRRFTASAAVLLTAFAMLVSGGVAQAATPTSSVNGGNGLRVSPVRNDLTIQPGKSQTIDVYVENITDSPADLNGIVNDFGASTDESGEPRVYLDPNTSAPSHGLKQYIAPIGEVKLDPKQQKIVKVTINIPKDAAGGGYFGAVRFVPTSTDKSKNVSLSASVGSLILVTVPGDIKEQMGVASLNVSRGDGKAATFFTSGNGLKTTIRFKNSGNVQELPFGKLLLKKSGKEIASYEINNTQPRGAVLPDSIRRFEQAFGDKTSSVGKYTLVGSFGYGSNGQLINASTTFYVVPLPFIIVGILVLALVVFAAVALPRMIRNHDRGVARKMRRK